MSDPQAGYGCPEKVSARGTKILDEEFGSEEACGTRYLSGWAMSPGAKRHIIVSGSVNVLCIHSFCTPVCTLGI